MLALALSGCASPQERATNEVPVVYKLWLLNLANEGRFEHGYGKDMPKTGIVAGFIKRTSASGISQEGPHVEVRLIPLVHAKTCQRPIDLVLEGTGLGAFIDYLEPGAVPYLPDHIDRIPVEAIKKDLFLLSRELGGGKPKVEPFSFIHRESRGRRQEPQEQGAGLPAR